MTSASAKGLRPVSRPDALRGGLAGALIVGATLLLYRSVLFVPAGQPRYPWGSDSLGHVFRAEFVQQQLAAGHLYPALLPDWYLGIQLLRYYPPLPYYLMIGTAGFTGDMVAAANWLLAASAAAGGLGWLLYRRWVGWLPAVLGGMLFLFLPDNLRVAFAEGNIPRAVATALLPFAFYPLLRLLHGDGSRRHVVGLALAFAAIVFCHAMMAAIYAASALVFLLAVGLAGASRPAQLGVAGGSLVCGILLSGWWLLPSLSGGITELNAAAMSEALAVIPFSTYLSPLQRAHNPEVTYVGALLLVAAGLAFWPASGRQRVPAALALTGLAGILITTPGVNALFNALPLHNLLWPLRFLGVASFMLLLALAWNAGAWLKKAPWLVFGVAALLAADQAVSLRLIHLRPLQPDTAAISQSLGASPGWRQATLDLSLLGSEPSYYYASLSGREQVFGWAYQGARSAAAVAAVNEALYSGFAAYMQDRLDLYGVDDVVLLRDLDSAPAVATGLAASGFELAYSGELTDLYHRDGAPRGFVLAGQALGIGRGAQNLAYLFPQIVLGTWTQVDAYSQATLASYPALVLSGFGWHDRERAESLVRQAAEAGVDVIVDLTGAPDDPLARIPRFLDVWGERIITSAQPHRVQGPWGAFDLLPFGEDGELWHTLIPQGAQHEALTFDYLGEEGVVLAYNTYGAGRVWFVGLNLPYHAALTQDPAAIRLLGELLRLPAQAATQRTAVALDGYQAGPTGYRFHYALAQPELLLVPVAFHEGMQVRVDGATVPFQSYEHLLAFEAPAGRHRVEIHLAPAPSAWVGLALSLLALAGIGWLQSLVRRP
jgi:uncharacterized membrane protein